MGEGAYLVGFDDKDWKLPQKTLSKMQGIPFF